MPFPEFKPEDRCPECGQPTHEAMQSALAEHDAALASADREVEEAGEQYRAVRFDGGEQVAERREDALAAHERRERILCPPEFADKIRSQVDQMRNRLREQDERFARKTKPKEGK